MADPLWREIGIGLVGDGDFEDLLQGIDASFDTNLLEDRANLATAGDILERLIQQLPQAERSTRCGTTMVFHQVKNALARIAGTERRLKPSTLLSDMTSLPPKRLFRELARDLEVRPIGAAMSWRGITGVILAAPIGLVMTMATFGYPHLWPTLIVIPVGLALIITDPGNYNSMTVGDVARKIAARQFKRLAVFGASTRPADIWRALCTIIEDETGFPASRIEPNTRLFPE